ATTAQTPPPSPWPLEERYADALPPPRHSPTQDFARNLQDQITHRQPEEMGFDLKSASHEFRPLDERSHCCSRTQEPRSVDGKFGVRSGTHQVPSPLDLSHCLLPSGCL